MDDQAIAESPSVEQRLEAMFDDGEPEQPEAEVSEATETPEGQAEEQEPTPSEPEEAEVVIDGKSYKVPKEISQSFIQQADYTRKTQEVAEARRVLEHEKHMHALNREFESAVMPDAIQMRTIDSQLEQYKKLDWSAMDTESIMRHRLAIDQLKDARAELEQVIGKKRTQFEQARQQKFGDLKSQALKALQASIPNWSDQTAQDVTKYATSEGYTDVELSNLYDPRLIKTMWKASQWDRLQASKPTVNNRAKDAPPVVRPGSSDPNARAKVDHMNFRKAIKNAPDSASKAKLIQQKLESKF